MSHPPATLPIVDLSFEYIHNLWFIACNIRIIRMLAVLQLIGKHADFNYNDEGISTICNIESL